MEARRKKKGSLKEFSYAKGYDTFAFRIFAIRTRHVVSSIHTMNSTPIGLATAKGSMLRSHAPTSSEMRPECRRVISHTITDQTRSGGEATSTTSTTPRQS